MTDAPLRQNISSAAKEQVNLDDIDPRLFCRPVFINIFLGARRYVPAFFRVDRRAGTSEPRRSASIQPGFDLHEQNMRGVLTDDVRFQMAAAVSAANDRLAAGQEILACQRFAGISDFTVSHSLQTTGSCVCARDTDQASAPFPYAPLSDIPCGAQIRIPDSAGPIPCTVCHG